MSPTVWKCDKMIENDRRNKVQQDKKSSGVKWNISEWIGN